jgi:carboxymethylenebutenolidase
MYEGLLAEHVTIAGHNGDAIEAYFGRPLAQTNVPGVVIFHHMPGWDEWHTEVVRKFAHHGYAAICMHLYSRLGPGRWDDLAAAARAAGGVSDAQSMGDAKGAADYLRALPYSNGKVGVIGFCSGGRQTVIAACSNLGFDAAVDCWGGRVVAAPQDLNEKRPVAPIAMTANLSCPLLGIFGNDDSSPSPEQVNQHEEELKKHSKTYEFHRYDGAGHGFFAVDRAGYRPVQATDAWGKVFDFYGRYLKTA